MRVLLRASAALTLAAALSVQLGAAQVAARPPGGPIRVLFIGNSYTYVNNLPELVGGLAAGMATPVAIEAEQVTVGGATLRQLWEAGPALAAIRRAPWDFVVLQEQSSLGATMVNGQTVISDPNRLFWPAARRFDQEIRKAGARTVFLETWGGQRNAPQDFDALAHAYFTIAKELHAIVIPAGLAWQRALAERGELPLYMSDGSHPAPAGSYLVALATVAALLDTLPDAAPLVFRGHPIGLDGKPASSLDTLAAIDSATFQLFRRVVAGIRQEIKRAGGYLAVAPPVQPTLPLMPSGRPIPTGGLAGTWTGTLQLFTPGGQPLTLDLRPKAGGGSYTGTAAFELDKPIREDRLEVTIDGREVRFSMLSPVGAGLRIQFVGVLTADDRLEGKASIVSEERGWDLRGAWSATRR